MKTLARDVGTREQGMAESEVPDDKAEQILASLRHVDLPHLSEAGLIEYDPEEGMVAYERHPLLQVSWLHSVLEHDFRLHLTGNPKAVEVGTIEGAKESPRIARCS